MLQNTYWNKSGTFQTAVEKLNQLIPDEGSVDHPRSTNCKLEKFRKASNCYYDLYNNGLCNSAREFRTVFGFASSNFKRNNNLGRGGSFTPRMYTSTEKVMDYIVVEAAQEQGIAVAADCPRVHGEYS